MKSNIFLVEINIPQGNERDQLCALLWNENIEGIEEGDTHIKVYAMQEDVLKQCIFLYQLYPYEMKQVSSENWNELWEKNYDDVYVENLLHIRAPHHTCDHRVAMEITIQPQMSFGTGHHSTTYLMAKNMFEIDFVGKSVLDMGTGTGILAIIAEKLKATKIVAVDNDPICIENTKENIELNQCKNIVVKHSSDFEYQEKYDILTANIHQHYLVENVSLLYSLLSHRGILLMSGFLDENIALIKSIYDKHLLCIKEEIKTNNEHWAFLMFEKI